MTILDENNQHSRLLIISNRLPFEIETKEGQSITRPGSGGLVTALAPVLKNRGGMWIGWTGQTDIEEENQKATVKEASKLFGFEFSPVFLTKQEIDLYYYGFSNKIIWPLFHDLTERCQFQPSYWESYKSVNKKFAEVISNQLHTTDFVWVHDYHLMLVAEELRKKTIQSRMGFFLHIPFPSVDIFVKLPWRYELINALLAFDLLGFQTMRDRQNFIQCVRHLSNEVIIKNQRNLHICKKEQMQIRVGAFPISIDYREFNTEASSPTTSEAAWLLHEKWSNQRLILSVDRLDYTKGIPLRLKAIELFLSKYPEFAKKVSFIQIMIPSRTEISDYQSLKDEVDRLVGQINSRFTIENWIPIQHVFHSFSRADLLSYYRTCEVLLVTPVKDGMNLVAKEYVACNIEKNGALILSEFAGAASQLYQGALLVNPYDIEGVAQAIQVALTMASDEKRQRMHDLRKVIKRYDIFWWMKMFLNAAFDKELNDFPISENYLPKKSNVSPEYKESE